MISPYTIFAIYQDTHYRHTEVIRAHGPNAAEMKYRTKMKNRGELVYVAAVVEGDVPALDTWTDAATMGHV